MLPKIRKVLVVGALVVAAALIPTTAAAQYGTRTFTVVNYSHYRINHMYFTPTGYAMWGGDRLGRDVLPPNYEVSFSVVRGWYDVMLVDQGGGSCVVPNVDFRNGETWTITDDVLLVCEVFSHN